MNMAMILFNCYVHNYRLTGLAWAFQCDVSKREEVAEMARYFYPNICQVLFFFILSYYQVLLQQATTRYQSKQQQYQCTIVEDFRPDNFASFLYRLVREEVGDVNILVNNAGIMVIKQVLPNYMFLDHFHLNYPHTPTHSNPHQCSVPPANQPGGAGYHQCG